MEITKHTIDDLLNQAKYRNSFEALPNGRIYKNLSTIIIIPTRGTQKEKGFLNCEKCNHKNEYTTSVVNGLHPIFVESFKRLIKPMNVPVIEMMMYGMEVGAAYNTAVENILKNPAFNNFRFILTVEDDNITPFIPNSQGPMMMLYDCIERGIGYEITDESLDELSSLLPKRLVDRLEKIKNKEFAVGLDTEKFFKILDKKVGRISLEYKKIIAENSGKGFDIAGGLYWTKGTPSMPLIYGVPSAKNKDPEGYFKVRFDWKSMTPGPIECNGMGMGFTLFKLDIFRDKRLERPWFKTCSEHTAEGIKQYTQDLYFFEKARKLGYRACVDTRVKVGHLDTRTGIIY